MIIDSHVHFGTSVWGDATPAELLDIVGNIDFVVCSNLEGIESVNFKDEYTTNLEMLNVAKEYPKIKPLAVCQPNISENANVIRKLLEENKEFIGLKFHPECMKLAADSEKYNKYLEFHNNVTSNILLEKPHSLSYQEPILTKFPDKTFVCVSSKIELCVSCV